jgi:predicted nucleic acid-binding protein
MVKTRSQNKKDSATRSAIITEGVITRSQQHKHRRQHQYQTHQTQNTHTPTPIQKELKKKELPKVELTDRIKNTINKRQQLRKKIHRNQTSILNEIQTDASTSKTQNNHEMSSVWKNFESIFKYIDDFMSFKKRVEGKSIYLI